MIIEVGPRDMAAGKLAVLRRDRLWNAESGKPAFTYPALDDFAAGAGALLEAIQQGLFAEARARRDANITRGVTEWAAVVDHFENGGKYPGWVEVEWARPSGAALEQVIEQLKAAKLTIRNVPRGAEPPGGTCIFTGARAVERIIVARAY